MSLPSLRLKANADRRLRAGHLWVYSNEVDTAATPLSGFAAGDQAILEAAGGKPLGIVGVSPNNLICARLLSRDLKHSLDKSLLAHRIPSTDLLVRRIANLRACHVFAKAMYLLGVLCRGLIQNQNVLYTLYNVKNI